MVQITRRNTALLGAGLLAAPAIASGRLVRVLPQLPAAPRHVYAVYPTSRHLQPKVKAFVDFLVEHLPAAMQGDC